MVDCEVLAIYLVAGIILAAGTKLFITRVAARATTARERICNLRIREVVVGMISNLVGAIGAKLAVAAFAEAGVIGSSSPLQGSRPQRAALTQGARVVTSA